jgi:hypothetical protein
MAQRRVEQMRFGERELHVAAADGPKAFPRRGFACAVSGCVLAALDQVAGKMLTSDLGHF